MNPQTNGASLSGGTLHAVYDLSTGPITFDAVRFFVLTELYRRQLGLNGTRVHIIPGADAPFRNMSPRDKVFDHDRKWRRVHRILAQLPWLMPGCKRVDVYTERPEALPEGDTFPQNYDLSKPQVPPYAMKNLLDAQRGGYSVQVLETRDHRRRKVKDQLTISLRSADFQPERNSDLDAWKALADHAISRGWKPVIIPDIEGPRALDFPGCKIDWLAAENIGARMNRYEQSALNMGVTTGPAAMCEYGRHAALSIITKVNRGDIRLMTKWGFPPGSQMGFPNVRHVWKDDTIDVLIREFDNATHAADAA